MAIGVRDITNLEELLEVQDDDKIIVIQNGEAKLISKANAKFGGGTVTVFYGDINSSSSEPIILVDVNGNPISAQAAYDAVMSGPVYIYTKIEEQNTEIFAAPFMVGVIKSDVGIVTVAFMCKNMSKTVQLYAGIKPV